MIKVDLSPDQIDFLNGILIFPSENFERQTRDPGRGFLELEATEWDEIIEELELSFAQEDLDKKYRSKCLRLAKMLSLYVEF